MSSTEIRYCIDNREKINEELEKIFETLPQETIDTISDSFDDGNVVGAYNIINRVSPNFFSNNGLSLSSLKLLSFISYPDPESKDKLFSNEEYIEIIKELADIYGTNLSEVIDIKSPGFNASMLDALLSQPDPKYADIYRAVLEKKLSSSYYIKDVIEVIKNSNTSVITENLITNFLENYNTMDYIDVREFLKSLPSSILQDGNIAKTMIGKISNMYYGIEEILDYIPSSEYDSQFVNEILNKSGNNFVAVFEHIPIELRTRDIWERACNRDTCYLNEIPINNIDPNISQEEYTSWVEDLITKKITEYPDRAISIFSNLDDSRKTISICQNIAEILNFESNSYRYNDFLKSIPENSRTQQLYETLVSKSSRFLRDIPLQSFVPSIPQEEYHKWFEILISQSIANTQDMNELHYSIPRDMINERLWNEFLDKCLEKGNDTNLASISMVNFENMTPQMVERAMKDISVTQLCDVPCIDQNLDNLYDEKKEIYAKWQSSFTEEQKQAYRTWYEQTWIKYVTEKKTSGDMYSSVPIEAITTAMNKASIDVDFAAIKLMPLPETQEQLHEYQQMLIYALGKWGIYGNMDVLENIQKEFISEEVVRTAIEKSIVYLTYANPTSENFGELIDIAYKNKLASMGRTELTEQEKALMHKFAVNNAELFKTLQLEILDPKIISTIGESSLEKITRYEDVQYLVLDIYKDESALKAFGFALENLKMDSIFIEPLIEKLSSSILGQKIGKYSSEAKGCVYESAFLDLVSQRIDRKDIPFTNYEKAIISYLALNPQEGQKIANYDDILTFVERKNVESENIVNNNESSLLEVKNAYLERLVGLNYGTVANLVTIYGNDPQQLLQNYRNVNPESFKELGEKEALEIIIKLKSLIETQDIDAIRSEFQKSISQERKEQSFIRYQKSTILETSLRRAYGREMVDSLSKNINSLQIQELEFEGEKYLVRKVDGKFNRMVSLLGAYRKPSTTDGDMYDRWNTNQMAGNHALCYSLMNQSNPGTAMIRGKTGVIISIDGFSPESVSAAAPYDLCSDNRMNTIFTWRQQRFFSAQNMPNQTRGMYSEYDIEIQDVLSGSDTYKKIQPATIICFEEVDEDSIRVAIELGKKLDHPVPIELIDRRELANAEMQHITEALNKFKTGESINPILVSEIIERFNNVRNAHRFSNLSDELLGENEQNENELAPFNIEHLNQMLKECLASVEQKIRSGQVTEGLEALESIKMALYDERQKSFLMPTMYEKQSWTGIDMDIDYTLDELQRTYGKQVVKPLEEIKTLEVLSQMQGHDLSSVTFDSIFDKNNSDVFSEQLSVEQIMQIIDVNRIQESIAEIHSQGFYQGNKYYDEEHIARVIMYSEAISQMEGFDEKTRGLLSEVAKYYSCGRQLDIVENHGQYSAKLAGKSLADKYSAEELCIIQATIELQNFRPSSSNIAKERKAKLTELCSKYGISEEQSDIVSKMFSCIRDSVTLDRARFVEKAKDKTQEQFGCFIYFKSESAKKMIEFSFSIQEQLAQQELDRLSVVVQMDFKAEKEQIMEEFFTIHTLTGKVKTKNESITQSPIVRLEYLKTKYPEIARMDLDALSKRKQSEVVVEKTKSPEALQQKEQIRNLRRQQFVARISELGLQADSVLTLDTLFQHQEFLQQQSLEASSELKEHHGMKI